MPFKIKLTLADQTRKFPVTGSGLPSYDQLLHKIRSVFSLSPLSPLSLEKILFSPLNTGQILLASSVVDESGWKRVVRHCQGAGGGLPDGTMKFVVRVQSYVSPTPGGQQTPTQTTSRSTPAPTATPTPSSTPAVAPPSLAKTLDISRLTLAELEVLSKRVLPDVVSVPAPTPVVPSCGSKEKEHVHSSSYSHPHSHFHSATPAGVSSTPAPTDTLAQTLQSSLRDFRTHLSHHALSVEQELKKGQEEMKVFLTSFLDNYGVASSANFGGSEVKEEGVSDKEEVEEEQGGDEEEEKKNAVFPGKAGGGVGKVGVWCDACGERIGGVRFKCLERENYDLCVGCFGLLQHDEYKGTEFDKYLKYEPIYHPSLAQNLPLTSVVPKPVAKDAPVKKEKDEGEEGHPARCDYCGGNIKGERWKCLGCEDFDCCESCKDLIAGRHDASHSFVRLTSSKGAFYPTPPSFPLVPLSAAHALTHAKKKEESEELHRASCDLCLGRIRGERWKCLECGDFDACGGCKPLIPVHHPTHTFVRVHSASPSSFFPPDLPTSSKANGNVVHRGVFCDGCDFPIRGIRFKCVHPACEDFDLCEGCEAAPGGMGGREGGSGEHERDHPMLKLRTNLNVDARTWLDEDSTAHQQEEENSTAETTAMTPAATRTLVNVPCPTPLSQSTASFTTADAGGGSREVVLKYIFDSSSFSLASGEEGLKESLELAIRLEVDEAGLGEDVKGVEVFDGEEDGVGVVEFESARAAVEFVSVFNGSLFADRRSIAFLHNGETVFKKSSPASNSHLANPELTQTTTPHASVVVHDSTPTLVVKPSPEAVVTEQTEEQRLGLHALFVEDVTVKDGDRFPSGALFIKSWKLRNNGSTAFHSSTSLHFAGGVDLARSHDVAVGSVQPGEEFVVHVEMKAPEAAGRYLSFWRLRENGEEFGDRVWIDIVVSDPALVDGAADDDAVNGAGGGSSLGSSSIIMPSPPSVRATTQTAKTTSLTTTSDDGRSTTGPSTLSALSTTSGENDDEVGSDVESVPESDLSSAFDEFDDDDELDGEELDGHEAQADGEWEVVYDEALSDGELTEAE